MINLHWNPRGSLVLRDLDLWYEKYQKMKERTNKIKKLLDKNTITKNE